MTKSLYGGSESIPRVRPFEWDTQEVFDVSDIFHSGSEGWGDALQNHSGDVVHMNDSTNNLPRFSTKSFH